MVEQALDNVGKRSVDLGWRQRALTSLLRANMKAAQALGWRDLPQIDSDPRPTKEQLAWVQQIDHLVNRGFHAALGLSEQEYRASIPQHEPPQERYKDRFPTPLLVDPRVSANKQIALHKVDRRMVSDAELTRLALLESQRLNVLQQPYQIWISMQNRFKEQEEMEWDEQGLTIIEALAVLREFPEYYKKNIAPEIPASESRIVMDDNTYSFLLRWWTPEQVYAIYKHEFFSSRILKTKHTKGNK